MPSETDGTENPFVGLTPDEADRRHEDLMDAFVKTLPKRPALPHEREELDGLMGSPWFLRGDGTLRYEDELERLRKLWLAAGHPEDLVPYGPLVVV